MVIRKVILILLYLSVISLEVPGPVFSGNLTQELGELEENFSKLHKAVLSSPTPAQITPNDLDMVVGNLRKLNSLGREIDSFNLDVGIPNLQTTVYASYLRSRKLTWLHAWAIFSNMVVSASLSGDDVNRAKLIGLKSESVLNYLLAIYGDIRKHEMHASPDVRALLNDSSDYILRLKRDVWYPSTDPSTSNFFIPGPSDLLGEPTDEPPYETVPVGKRLLSLWAIINLQLDTWHTFQTNSASRQPGFNFLSKESPAVIGNLFELSQLIDWLEALRARKELSAFCGKEPCAISGSGKAAEEDYTAARLKRISHFLKFRQSLQGTVNGKTSEMRWNAVITALRDDRLCRGGGDVGSAVACPSSNGDISLIAPLLADLKIAQQPLFREGGNKLVVEELPEAGIWFRYLLLASYQDEGPIVLSKEENGLAKVWEFYKKNNSAYGEHQLGRCQPESKMRKGFPVAFLRLNQLPPEGHSSNVICSIHSAVLEYLQFERGFEDFTKGALDNHFGSDGQQLQKAYYEQGVILEQSVEHLFKAKATLSSYLGGVGKGVPFSSATKTSGITSTFHFTATPGDQRWIGRDLLDLDNQLTLATSIYSSVHAAYSPSNAESLAAAMQALNAELGFGNRNIYSSPSKTYKQYSDALKAAVSNLKEAVTDAEAEVQLRSQFQTQAKRVQQSREELMAAEFGKQIADKALELNGTYERIAELSAQIESLGVEIAEADRLAAEYGVKAEALRLSTATKMRDLAQARVDGLIQARAQAQQIVSEAVQRLNSLKGELIQVANQKEEQSKRNGLFKIVKGVVAVVGIVAAPFTGGTSLTIAATVSQGIDVAKKAIEIDWSKGWNALQDFGAVVTQAAVVSKQAGFEFSGISGFKNETLSKIQEYAKTVDKTLTPLKNLPEALRDLKDPRTLTAVSSALASGFPIGLDLGNSKLEVKVGAGGIALTDTTLVKHLEGVLAAGGVIVNNIATRTKVSANLPELSDAELKPQLGIALDQVFQQLPDSLADRFGEERKTFSSRLGDLKAYLAGVGVEQDKSRRVVAQILATGMILIETDTKSVIAVRAESFERITEFQRVIEKQKKTVDETVKKILKDIQGKSQELNERVAQASGSDDDGTAIRQMLQAGEVDKTISGIQNEMQSLESELTEAQNEVKDFQTGVDIATLEQNAANAKSRSASLGAQRAMNSKIRAEYSNEVIGIENILRDYASKRAGHEFKAQLLKLKIEEDELSRLYLASLARGFNPMTEQQSASITNYNTIHGVIYSRRSEYWGNKPQLENVINNFVGMLRWYSLIKSNEPDSENSAAKYYIRLLTTTRTITTKTITGIQVLGKDLDDAIKSQDGRRNKLTARVTPFDGLAKYIYWFDNYKDSVLLEDALGLVPKYGKEKLKLLGLARVTYKRNGTVNPLKDWTSKKFANGAASYYVDLENSVLVLTPRTGDVELPKGLSDLTFVVRPPTVPMANPNRPMGDVSCGTENNPKNPVSSSLEAILGQNVSKALAEFQNLCFIGAEGDWTIIILHDSADPMNREEILETAKQVDYKVYLPLIEVD